MLLPKFSLTRDSAITVFIPIDLCQKNMTAGPVLYRYGILPLPEKQLKKIELENFVKLDLKRSKRAAKVAGSDELHARH